MATQDEHREKAEHNEYLASTLDNPFWDWKICVIFYAALHYVESYLAAKKYPRSTKPNHTSRLQIINKYMPLIYKDYEDLYNDSRDARYEADLTFTQKDVLQLQKKLDAIKALILPAIKPATTTPAKPPATTGGGTN